MKINDLLNEFQNSIIHNNKEQIEQLKHSIIHPDDGAYFAVYKRVYKIDSLNNKWCFTGKLFENKDDAKKYLENEKLRCENLQLPFNQFEIRRVVVHETNIDNYL